MIASFRGGQYVVGVAGNATCLVDNLPERRRLAKLLGTSRVERANEAWAVGQVRKAFGDDRETFMEKWNREAPWGPSWRCPADSFLWLDRPVLLHPEKIRGKSRLVTMYSSSQTIERHQAQSILMSIVNSGYQHQALDRIGMICAADVSEVDDDIDAIRRRSRRALGPTSKQQLVDARRGQGRFRRDLERHWSGCAVTGCTLNEVLRASHIRPWRSSTDEERLDAANGLLLVANLDALFDCGRISFADDGQLLLSPVLTEVHLAQLGITRHSRLSRPLNAAARGYLASHRKLYSYQD
ncbi:MAG: HNH endonuclease [Burkholderiaceae bacterium]|nr:HNH endonuclease [Burkholderiaceae bacterium]